MISQVEKEAEDTPGRGCILSKGMVMTEGSGDVGSENGVENPRQHPEVPATHCCVTNHPDAVASSSSGVNSLVMPRLTGLSWAVLAWGPHTNAVR